MDEQTENVSAAIIGTGFMGRVHAEALRRLRIPIAGILGSTPQKSRSAAQELGIPQAYDSLDDLLNDPAVTAIHINTPNRQHYDMARRAIAANRHVMCEKPLAMTSEESRALVQLASEHPQLVTGVNYNIRFYPLMQEMRARLQSKRIFHMTGSYVQDWLLHATDYNWRVLAEEGGALRAVADIGTHWLDLIQHVSGLQVCAVCADLQTVHATRYRPQGEVRTFSRESSVNTTSVPITTDDAGTILLRFSNGSRGSLHVSQVTAGRKNCLQFHIATEDDSLAWNSEQPNQLWLGHRGRPNEILLKDPSLLTERAAACADNPGGHNEGFADTFKQCFAAFYQQIAAPTAGQSTAFASFADGHREIVLCETILASHQKQAWLEVTD